MRSSEMHRKPSTIITIWRDLIRRSANAYDGNLPPAGTDTDQSEYERMVNLAKRHIVDGDIFQVVLSRTITEPCPDEPLDVYKRLRKLNPSPYMFYINTPNTTLIGSSPELNVRVSGKETRYRGNTAYRRHQASRPYRRRDRPRYRFPLRGRTETRPQGTCRAHDAC